MDDIVYRTQTPVPGCGGDSTCHIDCISCSGLRPHDAHVQCLPQVDQVAAALEPLGLAVIGFDMGAGGHVLHLKSAVGGLDTLKSELLAARCLLL